MLKIKSESIQYRIYKQFQRSTNTFYPTFMICSVVFLSVLSNTIFSIGIILFFSFLMYNHHLFFKIEHARRALLPIFQYLILPLIMLEVFLNFVIQLPFEIFNEQNKDQMLHIPQILGLYKYWRIIEDSKSANQYKYINDYNKERAIQLILKVIMICIINIQSQIINSIIFSPIKDLVYIGKMKGQAITWRFNNIKIKNYL